MSLFSIGKLLYSAVIFVINLFAVFLRTKNIALRIPGFLVSYENHIFGLAIRGSLFTNL